jgi:acrylyl-CoA reductase (NADPH)
MSPDSFQCFLVTKTEFGQIEACLSDLPMQELPDGEVLVEVEYSSLNYKDALAATGHPGIVRQFPHVPGVDVCGTVVHSESSQFQAGDSVIITGYDQGAGHWGGWSRYARVPADWVVPLPDGLTSKDAAIYGTAGLTAALCVQELIDRDITPESGEIAVTGATGGVGIMAVMILARLGFTVVAVSGKPDQYAMLKELGAAETVGRDAVDDQSDKPLLSSRWAGAVDTVGGNTLSTLLRASKLRGCVAACGLVGGTDLPVTVYPFILRGVALAGVDTAWYPMPKRRVLWQKLATDWRPASLEAIATQITLSQADEYVQRMLASGVAGRTIIAIQ